MKTHRELAEQLDLFHSEQQAPGMLFWHPNGWHLFQKIQEHMRRCYRQYGFKEVRTPQLMKKSLWQISGHMAMYADDMFFGGEQNGDQEYALKPMSCPAHILMYKRGVHSYRDLPLRLFEFGLVHRNESSGSLNGSLRLRQFTQDDAHVFCAWSQAKQEICLFLKRAKQIYNDYGYQALEVKISTQPEQALGDEATWRRAEEILKSACQAEMVPYEIQVGEGAFYGPKIELALQDAMGRIWQCGTVQLDFNLPERFALEFNNDQGEVERPIILHQAVYGSIERWIGILLEVSQGVLPEWVHPQPVALVTVDDSVLDYANQIRVNLEQQDINVLCEFGDHSVGRKIKRGFELKIPNIIIIGAQEAKTASLSIRRGKQIEVIKENELVSFLKAKQGR
ncbi:threonine--tRNA ligase [Marinomonas spartinae]|uniref:threonine--tRNA ligase n=1 Tax=Marinomonas spartinae TaxID=1792290 RepID=UPI0018F1D937|nr:threonine--tRNA ligase [Marinomonas spartinae]MBJ7554360.1 threonine--tRNA ligase [Marinomonas spartinae]